MAEKTFALRTEPHTATVGPHQFLFQPEVNGAEFVQAYAALRLSTAQQAKPKKGEEAEVTPEALEATDAALREFLSTFMLPESAEAFEPVRLPTRVLVELLHWVVELYGGGAKERPTG